MFIPLKYSRIDQKDKNLDQKRKTPAIDISEWFFFFFAVIVSDIAIIII